MSVRSGTNAQAADVLAGRISIEDLPFVVTGDGFGSLAEAEKHVEHRRKSALPALKDFAGTAGVTLPDLGAAMKGESPFSPTEAKRLAPVALLALEVGGVRRVPVGGDAGVLVLDELASQASRCRSRTRPSS